MTETKSHLHPEEKTSAVNTNACGANYNDHRSLRKRRESGAAKIDSKGYNIKVLEPKSEFRAFPLIKRPGNFGENTQSITKLFQCTPSLQNTVQKQEDLHKGRITVPLALHSSMSFTTLINRHTGGQIQLLSCLQSWENASTAAQPV